jgi:hypothetical protein
MGTTAVEEDRQETEVSTRHDYMNERKLMT